jgi:hypothetical protein
MLSRLFYALHRSGTGPTNAAGAEACAPHERLREVEQNLRITCSQPTMEEARDQLEQSIETYNTKMDGLGEHDKDAARVLLDEMPPTLQRLIHKFANAMDGLTEYEMNTYRCQIDDMHTPPRGKGLAGLAGLGTVACLACEAYGPALCLAAFVVYRLFSSAFGWGGVLHASSTLPRS